MVRKQARKKRPMKKTAKTLPRVNVPWKPILAGMVTLAFCFAIVGVSGRLLDRPIRIVDIEAPMQRVTSKQIQAVIEPFTRAGFITADLTEIRNVLEALDWVDAAIVRRRWPDRLQVLVVEQVPAARWQQTGLLNTRGELFVTGARHIPQELPELSGPDGTVTEVARRYLAVNGPLIEAGLGLDSITLDDRGAWEIRLQDGVVVRFGRREIEQRSQRFLDVASSVVARKPGAIDFVDMRYSNGFSVGWKDPAAREALAENPNSRPMLAAERGSE